MKRHASPPILGMIFLFGAVGAVAWASNAETDPVIDKAPAIVPAPPPAPATQPRAGAEATRMAELTQRTLTQV